MTQAQHTTLHKDLKNADLCLFEAKRFNPFLAIFHMNEIMHLLSKRKELNE